MSWGTNLFARSGKKAVTFRQKKQFKNPIRLRIFICCAILRLFALSPTVHALDNGYSPRERKGGGKYPDRKTNAHGNIATYRLHQPRAGFSEDLN